MTFRPASIYGQDPGDASVEYSYLKVQEEIRLGVMDLRTYPNEGPREKERFLANAIAPRNTTLRILLIMVFALFGAGKKRRGSTRSRRGARMIPLQTETRARENDVVYNPNPGSIPFTNRRGLNRTTQPTEEPEPEAPQDEEMPEEETPEETRSIGLSEFIEIYKDAIARTVTEAYAPRYRPGEPGQDKPLPRLLRRPMGAQEHAVRGAALSLEVNPGTVIVGEMGTGKTYIGAAAAHMNGHRNVLVLCPPHLVIKWKREVEMTVPEPGPPSSIP